MRRPVRGISESRNSHVFFRTPPFHHLFTALFGSLRAQKTFYAMKRDEEKRSELQSRREFFKNAAKKTLPILGAIVLAGMPGILRAQEKQPMSCEWGCEGGCSYGCQGSCYGSCEGSCHLSCESSCKGYCEGGCKYTCETTCRGTCEGGCSFSSSRY